MRKLVLSIMALFALSLVAAACGETEVVKVPGETMVVTKEVVKEVPVEVVVTKEVVKEVMVPGETIVVEKEVVKEVKVPGETMVVTKEVVKEVPVEVVVTKEVIKEVKVPGETVVVTQEVVKTVEVVKEVIKEVPVEAMMAKRSPLIGELESATVLVGFVPAKYNEAPELAELVKQGKLPPVEERVGSEPLVLRPIHEIGKYGGTWRRGFIGPRDAGNAMRAVDHDRMLFWDVSGTKLVPHMAKAWKVSGDVKTTTIFLRNGHRWSDGAPFTADDFMFWYNDIYLNEEISPGTKTGGLPYAGFELSFKKVDDTTVQMFSPGPISVLPTFLASTSAISGHARWGRSGLGGFAPMQYLKQFHPKYADGGLAGAEKMAKDAGFDKWVTFFKQRNSSFNNTELPVLTAWTLEKPITDPVWVYTRNPYSIWMDEAGNQLPYIDEIRMTLGENLEVLNLRAIAGEFDQMARHMDLQKVPVMLENAQAGNYTVRLDPTFEGGEAYICANQLFDADPEIGKWLRNVDFRRALSLGVNRQQLNEGLFLGLGVPGSIAPSEDTIYSPGPDSVWRNLWSTYDPETANQMLDGMGLINKDSEGFRLRTDGKGRLTIELQTYVSFMDFTGLGELVKEHWRTIGIDLDVKEMERSLAGQRRAANLHHLHMDNAGGADDMYGHPAAFFPSYGSQCMGPGYGKWYASNGTDGIQPMPEMAKVFALYRKGMTLGDKARVETGKEIWRIVLDEVWGIGTVGISPSIQGVRVVNNNLGNTASRHINSSTKDNPATSHPEQYYFKK